MQFSTSDTILNFLVVILPTALSVLGCFMTPDFLPPKYKWWWRGGLVALGIAISGLTLWQQSRTSAQNEKVQNDLRESLRSNELSNQYLRGQLETISNVLGQVAVRQANTGVDKNILSALTNIAQKATVTNDNRSALEKMTNRELKAKVLAFTKQMVEWSGKMDQTQYELSNRYRTEMMAVPRDDKKRLEEIWNSETQKMIQFNNQYQTEFKRDFTGTAISFKDELLRRLGPQSPPAREERPLALEGWITSRSIDWTALYLDKLARKLPD